MAFVRIVQFTTARNNGSSCRDIYETQPFRPFAPRRNVQARRCWPHARGADAFNGITVWKTEDDAESLRP